MAYIIEINLTADGPERGFVECEAVNSHALRDGDLIVYQGALICCSGRRVYPMRAEDCPDTQGDTVVFDGAILNGGGAIPKSWQKDWKVQGNKLAQWSRVLRMCEDVRD